MKKQEITQSAYEAYADVADWTNHVGNPMPQWDELPPKIQQAWEASCDKAIRLYLETE